MAEARRRCAKTIIVLINIIIAVKNLLITELPLTITTFVLDFSGQAVDLKLLPY